MNGQKKRILFLEDQFEASQFHIDALIDEGYNITVTAKEKLIFTPRKEPFDLLLLDIMIKAKEHVEDERFEGNLHFEDINWSETGLEFFKRIRQGVYTEYGLLKDITCIVVTATADADVIEQLFKLEPKRVIWKPYKVETLLLEVRSVFKE